MMLLHRYVPSQRRAQRIMRRQLAAPAESVTRE